MINTTAGKYIPYYRENGRALPMYFVSGELDGRGTAKNSFNWGRCFTIASFCSAVKCLRCFPLMEFSFARRYANARAGKLQFQLSQDNTIGSAR